jgi:hypothetical protein
MTSLRGYAALGAIFETFGPRRGTRPTGGLVPGFPVQAVESAWPR